MVCGLRLGLLRHEHRESVTTRRLCLLRRLTQFPLLRRDRGLANMPPDRDDVQSLLLHQFGLLALVPLHASSMLLMLFLKATPSAGQGICGAF